MRQFKTEIEDEISSGILEEIGLAQFRLALGDRLSKRPSAGRSLGSAVGPLLYPIATHQCVLMGESDFSGAIHLFDELDAPVTRPCHIWP